jgi:hypothetical protein
MDPGNTGKHEPLCFRRGPSCSWIIAAPLFLGYCVVLYGTSLYLLATQQYGWLSLLFVVPGSFYVYRWAKAFRYQSATFDRRYEAVLVRRGLFIPLLVREYHFADIEALHLARKWVRVRRNKHVPVYPVSLELTGGMRALLLEYADYFQARRMVEEAAVYATLPLLDASVDPPQLCPADQVGKPLRSSEAAGRVQPSLAEAPRGSRCRIVWEGETAEVHLPARGLAFLLLNNIKRVCVLALLTGGASGIVWWVTGDAQTTRNIALGIVGYICLPLLSLFLLFGMIFRIRATTIRIDRASLAYRSRGLLFQHTRRIPHAELKSIRQDGNVIEILTARERIRFGDTLTAAERQWLCESLNKLAR